MRSIKPSYKDRIRIWNNVDDILEHSGYIFTLKLTDQELIRLSQIPNHQYSILRCIRIIGSRGPHAKYARSFSSLHFVGRTNDGTFNLYTYRNPEINIEDIIYKEVLLLKNSDKVLTQIELAVLNIFENMFENLEIKIMLGKYSNELE